MDAISGLGIPVMNHQGWIDRMRTRFAQDRDAGRPLGTIERDGSKGIVAGLDQKGDGRVDSAELMESLARPRFDDIATGLIRHRDIDGDETLSVDELRAPATTFNRIDQNDDSAVDKAELVDFLRGAPGHLGRLEPPHSGSAVSQSAFDYVAAELIHHRDSDGDEMLSADEWPALGNTFNRPDKNDDGEVDKAELVDFLRGVPGRPEGLGPLANKPARIAPIFDDEEMDESEEILSLLDEDQDEQAAAEQVRTLFPKANAYERITAMWAARADAVNDILYL